jgi:hypothetical protein
MLDIKDFSIFEDQVLTLKGFNCTSYWFLLSLIITFTIAYQVNIRKSKVYSMETLISVKEESNPLFTSNTSLVFTGGTDQVQTTTIQSRSHNELVVDKLQYYINYLVQGKYALKMPMGQFRSMLKSISQRPAGRKSDWNYFVSESVYEIRIPFESQNASLISYSDNSYSNTLLQQVILSRDISGERVSCLF